jgi:hypothetical protein
MQIEPHTRGTVGLRIAIHQQGSVFEHGKTCRQVDSGGGFAYTSLLISYTDYSCHFAENWLNMNE